MKVPSSGASLLLALMFGGGCAMKASSKARSPGAPPADATEKRGDVQQGMNAGDELEQLDAQLRQAEGELGVLSGAGAGGDDGSTLDVESKASTAVTPSVSPEPTPAAANGLSRCERVAMLAEQICQLRDRMCALADEHEGEERYSNACVRAGLSCGEAEQASDGCEAV